MIDKYKFFNNNFKYLLIVPYIVFFTLILFYFFKSDLVKAGKLDGIILYGNDTSSYISYAKSILDLNFSNIDISKFSYILLIAAVLFLNFSLTSIVIFQFATTIISSFFLYLICKKLFSKWTALICLFFFLTYLPIQLRNFYILTEILFINFSIILIYLSFFKQKYKFLIFLVSLFILFLRPQGFLIILSLFFTIIIFKKFRGIYNLLIKISLVFGSFLLLFFFINIGIHDYDLINSLSKGIIWGYSFETKSICSQDCIEGFTNPNLYKKNIFDFFLYIKDNFFILLKISFLKILLFFSGWRPYYSNLHNIYLILSNLTIFFLFSSYFLNLNKKKPLEVFSVIYVGLSTIFICFTFIDWSGRFALYIIPFMMIFSSKSLSSFILFFSNYLKKNKFFINF